MAYTVLRELDISDLGESEFTLLTKDGYFGKHYLQKIKWLTLLGPGLGLMAGKEHPMTISLDLELDG